MLIFHNSGLNLSFPLVQANPIEKLGKPSKKRFSINGVAGHILISSNIPFNHWSSNKNAGFRYLFKGFM